MSIDKNKKDKEGVVARCKKKVGDWIKAVWEWFKKNLIIILSFILVAFLILLIAEFSFQSCASFLYHHLIDPTNLKEENIPREEVFKLLGWAIAGIGSALGLALLAKRTQAIQDQADNISKQIKEDKVQFERKHKQEKVQFESKHKQEKVQFERKHKQETYFEAIKLFKDEDESIKLGAFYTLYGLAQEYKEEIKKDSHDQILTIICGFVRSYTQDKKYKDNNKDKPSALIQSILDTLFDKKKPITYINTDRKIDLNNAYLVGVNLNNTNLAGADLWEANLAGANLNNTNLAMAYLFKANLAGANLWYANLAEANLWQANLAGADLNNANLAGANLWNTNLAGAKLNNTNLAGANLFKANLAGANLNNTNLAGANLNNTNLAGAKLNNTNLAMAYLFKANLAGAYLFKANLAGANLWYANLAGADLWQANLAGAKLNEANLAGANLWHSLWIETECKNVHLEGSYSNSDIYSSNWLDQIEQLTCLLDQEALIIEGGITTSHIQQIEKAITNDTITDLEDLKTTLETHLDKEARFITEEGYKEKIKIKEIEENGKKIKIKEFIVGKWTKNMALEWANKTIQRIKEDNENNPDFLANFPFYQNLKKFVEKNKATN